FRNALLDLADAGEIFIQLLLIAVAELIAEAPGIVEDEVENRSLLLLPLLERFLALSGRTGAEETLEYQPRVGLGGHRRGRRLPGKVVLIRAGISGIAVARFAHGIARQLEGWEACQRACLRSGDLVNGNAAMDVGAGGFFHAHAGEEGSAGAGVVTGAVGAGRGI